MKSSFFSRRKFLGLSAAAAGATLGGKTLLLHPEPLFAEEMPAGEHVRFGMIGIGMQGSGLLGASIELPGIECVAACDLYDGRHTLAREITKNPSLCQNSSVSASKAAPPQMKAQNLQPNCPWIFLNVHQRFRKCLSFASVIFLRSSSSFSIAS